jgi:hypothetical protein
MGISGVLDAIRVANFHLAEFLTSNGEYRWLIVHLSEAFGRAV